jgi:predicted DNA-binding transcriptional regulator YafY
MCDQAEAIRLFRLDRIRQPQLLPDQAADSTESVLGSKLGFMGSQALHAIHQAPHATIRLTEKTQWLSEENWVAGDPEDPMLIRVPFLSQDWLVGWALSFGSDLQVIEPADMAARIVDTVCEGIDRLKVDG